MATVSRNGTGQNSENRQQAAIVPTIVDNGINKIWNLYFLMGEDNYEKMSSWENYEKLKSCETSAPLLGLSISYNENDCTLVAEPDDELLKTYKNAIMRDVAVKQSENCKIRYSKFIKVLD